MRIDIQKLQELSDEEKKVAERLIATNTFTTVPPEAEDWNGMIKLLEEGCVTINTTPGGLVIKKGF